MYYEERRALIEEAEDALVKKKRTHQSLVAVIVLITLFVVAQCWAAIAANSLAVLADSLTMLFDIATYACNLAANRAAIISISHLKHRGDGPTKFEVVAAIVSSISVLVVSIAMFLVALVRLVFSETEEVVNGKLMFLLAIVGFGVNGLSLLFLHSAGTSHEINVKSAILHIGADIMRGVAIVVAGLLVWGFQYYWADSVCTLVVTVLMMIGATSLLWESYGEWKNLREAEEEEGDRRQRVAYV